MVFLCGSSAPSWAPPLKSWVALPPFALPAAAAAAPCRTFPRAAFASSRSADFPTPAATAVTTARTASTASTATGDHHKSKPRIVILGSGWAGFQLLRRINNQKYQVTVVSPRNYFVFTPLLASTSVGTLEFRCVVEPVKRSNVEFYEANCEKIDFGQKQLLCSSTLEDFKKNDFTVPYDHLVIATGAVSNTFGIPGVTENAIFLKDIGDARRIRTRIMECFEYASQPNISEQERRDSMHFAVVGGGPTGVEFMAELHDYITEDVLRLYPNLAKYVTATIFDVGKSILGGFDASLSQYASSKFTRKGIKLRMGVRVKSVDKGFILLESGEVVPFGLLVWSTGVTPVDLIKRLDLPKDRPMGRLLTDGYLRVLDKEMKPMKNVFALGDCASIDGVGLPCTAQVANQKGVWLQKSLNAKSPELWPDAVESSRLKPFRYDHVLSLAYIGKWRAIADSSDPTAKRDEPGPAAAAKIIPSTGVGAWLVWRSAYFTMSVSVKNKILIPMFWFLTWIFGRDVSRLR
ncbi:pyridine nucleotide-disulfide oxidoreductase-domain-containing protein [Zopfochytrium polystomum]|nr:pyridine nucleotide-disulfide oxidoreductase-domain-containing protein [Zopfochytrium polystomum]